jgi:hypothetical protein
MPSLIFDLLSPLINVLPEKARIQFLCIYKHKSLARLKDPISFNDKINWRKLNDRNPIYPILADKLAVKKFIDDLNLDMITPKTLCWSNNLINLDLDQLPDDYVLKANHASGTNIIIRSGMRLSDKRLLELQKIWTRVDISKTFVEWGYSQIPVKFFAEEFLDFDKVAPTDYKFWVFGGKVAFVQVDVGRFQDHRRAFYDREWNKMPFLLTYPDVETPSIRPNNFNKMIGLAETLSQSLDFIRVDLYTDDINVYFGEITMYPGAGYEVFSPKKYDKIIGNMWNLKL